MRKFKKGQKVYWIDPAGETSGEYEVYNANEDNYANPTDDDFDERVILIGNGFSEAEVYAAELKIINPLSTEEAAELNATSSRISYFREELLQKMTEIVSQCDEQRLKNRKGNSFRVCDEDYNTCELHSFTVNEGKLLAELYYNTSYQERLIPVRELDVFTMFEIICRILNS